MNKQAKNVFGEEIIVCSENPLTGFYRNGCCDSGPEDRGNHMVCAVMTEEFLEFSKLMGNDLSTPLPQYNFPGLSPGDRWCLCVMRWKEAFDAGKAPQVVLEATNEQALDFVTMDDLLKHAWKEVDYL
ncbi:DUF2237 family protein [Rhodohalobacter mucosus]|uniref:DUF2237 domain-containing protein n=1 Tax=Rhodohalobacter mucosus TaxID=2079485 RepID=A0A316TVU7_9BACT|nr:DUF2237 domain-containing protein [Rhodohalobacter mucosus]PWN06652.1 DUF2237 domain-containing protein [Rhodohalobacter mucosus]